MSHSSPTSTTVAHSFCKLYCTNNRMESQHGSPSRSCAIHHADWMKSVARSLRPTAETIRIATLALALLAMISVVLTRVGSATSARPLVVHITIWPNLDITVAPKSFRRGTVLLAIKNRDRVPRAFSINGLETRKIEPHKILRTRVTFTRADVYSFTLPGYVPTPETGWKSVGGRLKVT